MARHHHHGPGASSVLDIGGTVGALVVYLSDSPVSGELEGCPAGLPGVRFHTGVHLRPVGAQRVQVALYPALTEGRCDILDPEGRAWPRSA